MSRIIEVQIYGDHVLKDSKYAGVRGEAGVTELKITFDKSWEDFANSRSIIFWDAYGENPVIKVFKGDPFHATVQIPAEAMARAGEMTFTVIGEKDGAKQKSATGTLTVKDSGEYLEPAELTKSVLEQMQAAFDKTLNTAEECKTKAQEAQDGAETAQTAAELAQGNAETAQRLAQDAQTCAETAQTAAEAARDGAVEAKDAIENMTVSGETLSPEEPASVQKTISDGIVNLHFGIPQGVQGPRGITPHIGDNGNWYIGNTDTGVSAGVVISQSTGYSETSVMSQKATTEAINTSVIEKRYYDGIDDAMYLFRAPSVVVYNSAKRDNPNEVYSNAPFSMALIFNTLHDADSTSLKPVLQTAFAESGYVYYRICSLANEAGEYACTEAWHRFTTALEVNTELTKFKSKITDVMPADEEGTLKEVAAKEDVTSVMDVLPVDIGGYLVDLKTILPYNNMGMPVNFKDILLYDRIGNPVDFKDIMPTDAYGVPVNLQTLLPFNIAGKYERAAAKSYVDTLTEKVDALDTHLTANILKGSASGDSAVVIPDVSPAEHIAEVTVRSKNLIPDNPIVTSGAEMVIDGVSITMTRNETGNPPSVVWELGKYKDFVGKTLTLSVYLDAMGSSGDTNTSALLTIMYGNITKESASNIAYISLSSSKAGQTLTTNFTVPPKDDSEKQLTIRFYMNDGKTVGDFITFSNIQLEEGSTATAYAPYVPELSAKIKKYGKNLLPYPHQTSTTTVNGITFTDNGDGTITANGTATSNATFHVHLWASVSIPYGTYMLSCCPIGGGYSSYRASFAAKDTDGNKVLDTSEFGDGLIFTANKPISQLYCLLTISEGYIANNLVFKPQMEVGTTITEYEPYIAPTEYAISPDGTVGVTLIHPTTTLISDTSGVIIDANYNRDINIAFNSLEKKISALSAALI